ncbi:hypothetical protein HMPREF1640_00730 [Prevotella sp. S7-1-8]|nr:hypothetical protein HMPREF1640_00730 [Prevotella sp. S7-1-8]
MSPNRATARFLPRGHLFLGGAACPGLAANTRRLARRGALAASGARPFAHAANAPGDILINEDINGQSYILIYEDGPIWRNKS